MTNSTTQQIVVDFSSNLGGSDYFLINQGYPDSTGAAPNGASLDTRSFEDSSYSHGTDLNPLSMPEIVKDAITVSSIPVDPNGIYLIIAGPDIASSSTGFCAPNTPPHHGSFDYFLVNLKYAFIGNPGRCPTTAAPQLTWPGPTPNDDFAADGIANSIAAVLSAIVTNPYGDGWFDRYGLENSAKCQGTFGTTYGAANGSRANIRLGLRDFLIQQNWVNAHKGYCAMASPQ